MSNALAISAVTTTLRNLLSKGVVDLPNQNVTTKPLDRARTGSANSDQLNIFLYHTTLSAMWRNLDMPRQVRAGETAQPPLALSLHYLVTAYGKDDDETLSHRWLGEAMGVLHDHPVLGAAEIFNASPDSELHLQVERVRLTPEVLPIEETSKLWTAFQTPCRVSAAYQADVVLIESKRPGKTPLPVLTRGKDDSGIAAQADLTPRYPTIEDLNLVDPVTKKLLPMKRRLSAESGEQMVIVGHQSFALGDEIAILGHHFAGEEGDVSKVIVSVRLVPFQRDRPPDILVPATDRTDEKITLLVPDVPSGSYLLTVLVAPLVEPDKTRETNECPFLIAPTITGLPLTMARTGIVNGLGDATLSLGASPDVRPAQRATLALGDREILANPRTAATDPLVFVVKAIGPGDFRIRLRVDGVDSHVVDFADPTTPRFDESQKVTLT